MMAGFTVSPGYFSLTSEGVTQSIQKGERFESAHPMNWQSEHASIYHGIIKSKELIKHIVYPDAPVIWLLPAYEYSPEYKKEFEAGLKQIHGDYQNHFLFYGPSSACSAIELAIKKQYNKVNLIAIDDAYSVTAELKLKYQGIAGGVLGLLFNRYGWHQIMNKVMPSADAIKDNPLLSLFTKLPLENRKITSIYTPSDGLDPENEAWLNAYSKLHGGLSPVIAYKMLAYQLGRVGSVLGLKQLLEIEIKEKQHSDSAILVITHTPKKHIAVSLYTWINKEVR